MEETVNDHNEDDPHQLTSAFVHPVRAQRVTAQSRHGAEMEALRGGKDRGYAWNLQRGLSLNNADLATTAECTTWQQ